MTRDELIKKMRKTFQETDGDIPTSWAAALDVVLGEVLGAPKTDEFIRQGHKDDWGVQCWYPSDFQQAIKDRRALYSKVKTAEEQVTISETTTGWWVHGPENKTYFALMNGFRKENAEIYRLGLIAQLKEHANANSK